MSRRTWLLLVLLLFLPACGTSATQVGKSAPTTSVSAPGIASHEGSMIGGDSSRSSDKEEGEVDTLVIKGNRFVPQPFAVAQDYGLIIVNQDSVVHNVTIVGAGTPLSVDIKPGEEYNSPEQLHRPAGHYVMYDKRNPVVRGTMVVSLRMMIVEKRGY